MPRRALAAAVFAALGLGLAAVLAGRSPGPRSELPGLQGFGSFQPLPQCVESVGEPLEEPAFRPASLPLPAGTVTIRTPEDPAPGLHVIVYAVPRSLDGFVDFVLDTWPAEGWELGRGEREPGEAESVFYLPDKSRYGQFRARAIYCDENLTEVTLTIGERIEGS